MLSKANINKTAIFLCIPVYTKKEKPFDPVINKHKQAKYNSLKYSKPSVLTTERRFYST